VFELPQVPFDATGLQSRIVGQMALWGLDTPADRATIAPHLVIPAQAGIQDAVTTPDHANQHNRRRTDGTELELAILCMGNPHAVLLINNVEAAPVATLGPWIEHHPRFARRVNVGFMQIVNRQNIKLRVFERDAGETLACGTGACAAAAAGMQMGLLDAHVEVQTRGGRLTIEWIAPALKSIAGPPQDDLDCDDHNPVFMTGPADIVFEGEIEL
jgi:diaminopimelate epimerase